MSSFANHEFVCKPWLLAAQRSAVHVHLGYGAFGEYVERMFGYKPRTTLEKLRVAEALESLPLLERALSSGELSWSAARELTRVALRETEHEWLEFAHGKTLRQLEQALAGKQPGDAPGSAPDPSARRHVLRFEVAAETFALFRDAMNELRRRAGAALAGGLVPVAPSSSGWPTVTPSTWVPLPNRAPRRRTTCSPTKPPPSSQAARTAPAPAKTSPPTWARAPPKAKPPT